MQDYNSQGLIETFFRNPSELPCQNLVVKKLSELICSGFFLFITTLRTSIQSHIFISVYLDYCSLENSFKCTGMLQIFIHPHWYLILDTVLILRSIELSIDTQTCLKVKLLMHSQLKNRLSYSSCP
jgi:hypothetical protein